MSRKKPSKRQRHVVKWLSIHAWHRRVKLRAQNRAALHRHWDGWISALVIANLTGPRAKHEFNRKQQAARKAYLKYRSKQLADALCLADLSSHRRARLTAESIYDTFKSGPPTYQEIVSEVTIPQIIDGMQKLGNAFDKLHTKVDQASASINEFAKATLDKEH